MKWPTKFFVTGTDTEIGKTVVSGILLAGLEADYWKPIQSGWVDGTDSDWIRRHAALPSTRIYPEAYSLREPLSPHAAAELEDIEIELESITLPVTDPVSSLIVEGAGGVFVPINRKQTMLDLIQHLELPALIVARSTLGTINHTLLTIEALRSRNIDIVGVVMNGPVNPGNREAIERFGNIKVLAEVSAISEFNPSALASAYHQSFASGLT